MRCRVIAAVVAGAAMCAAGALVAMAPAAGSASRQRVPDPTVNGPVPGQPASLSAVNLDAHGYIEQEFFVEGTARAYEPVGQLTEDGRWTVQTTTTAPYRTRVLVRRPKDPSKFNGVVETEWLNVSGGLDAAPDWGLGNAELLRSADPTRSPLPIYLGDDVALGRTALSPAGRWLLVVTTAKGYDQGRVGKLPVYVTESGYEEAEDERTRVGRNDPAPETLWLVDLEARTREKLACTPLPGIKDDPLASVRAENERARGMARPDTSHAGTDPAKPDTAAAKERSVEVSAIAFNPQGTEALVRLTANDNKDRWLATVDFEKHVLRPEHRLTDSAWVNWE